MSDFFIFKKSRTSIHFFNYLSIYRDSYMHTVCTEYWLGFPRKKVLTLGKITIWIRYNRGISINTKRGRE